MKTPHLVVSISGHGFGHVAQTAPILNALYQQLPQVRLTVRSAVTLAHLQSRIHAPFIHLPSEGDLGMVMSSAIDVLAEDSRRVYQTFHADWAQRVQQEAQLLRTLKADMVFSNVGYLPLAGAQQAGIPNVALCSLNWSDIYRHFCGNDAIAAQIQSCYAHADAFLRTTPGMAMSDLKNLLPIAPIADIGRNRRTEINRRLQLSANEKLVLISLGGIASRLPIENWPHISGVRWLVQQNWQAQHPDAVDFETLAMPFPDLLASCDALLCKPGYGSFVEAPCSGVPVLYVTRADWPESPALIAWLQQHGISHEVTREQLERGELANALATLWQHKKIAPVVATGATQVAQWLASRFSAKRTEHNQQNLY